VRSSIEIVAEYRNGRTVLRSIRGGLHFAARETGPGVVHLVGTAAGPLGGDEVTIRVQVGAGARLAVRSAGATIVQPGRPSPDSRLTLHLDVADEAELDVGCEPTVICHGAGHESAAVIELTGSGQVRLLEQVLLGRSGEPGGSWVGRTRLTRDGVPQLRHTLRSTLITGSGSSISTGSSISMGGSINTNSSISSGDGTRVISTLLWSGAEPAVAATAGTAAAMPLAGGGLLVTATGHTLIATAHDLRAAATASTAAATAVPDRATSAGRPCAAGAGAGS